MVTLSALLMTPVVNLLHSSHRLWEAADGHETRRHAVDAAMHYLARELHNAKEVTQITSPSTQAAAIEIRRSDDALLNVIYDPNDEELRIQVDNGPEELLSRGVTAVEFLGYIRGGTVTTTSPEQIESVDCLVQSRLPNNAIYQAKRRVWIRSAPHEITP